MTRTKIDNRIRILIENGIKLNHRTMFVVVGDKGRDQVMILHHLLTKATVKARPSVLWCYKKELGFTSHRKRRMKKVQKKIKGGKMNINEDDPFELFVASTNIRYCYYSETQKILGQTFGMCVLQDFEAITPNLLARTIETVEGGGVVVLLLRSLTSLKQLYTMSMDVHERYRTEAHQDIVGRFNERFLLSLSSCQRCLVVDEKLNVLPISSHVFEISCMEEKVKTYHNPQELESLKEALRDTQPVSSLVNCCKTLDQAKAVLKFIDAISDKTLKFTISLTAARGRGKSAAMGLAVAGAIAFGYCNIFVTSPSPDNLKTFFEFVFKGFDALGYQEHIDYGLVQSLNADHNKALIRVNVFKTNRQTIQYINPTDAVKLSHAELLVIDEAAAIPLPFVKDMFGPYLIFLSSTINGYEGTGRSLSLKLLQELRNQSKSTEGSNWSGRTLQEITLDESIRYSPNDSVEQWLTDLLCLNACNTEPSWSGIPPPTECELYYINRDTLFCYHKASESFLHKIMALYVSSHYKNSPNDLQLMSDAPAHHLFCLLGPVDPKQTTLPEVFCVIQVCLEGQISQQSVGDAMSQGRKPTGDLIPWTVAQQFQDNDFPALSGLRIVRIATHPDYQSMGYGSRALSLLKSYYELKFPILEESNVELEKTKDDQYNDLLEEEIAPRSNLPPLLIKLTERSPEKLDYLGVAYGLTSPLLKFWKRAGFIPVYLRQTSNDLTGEHSCIMLKILQTSENNSPWLFQYWTDFKRRFVSLLSYQFRTFTTTLGLGVLMNENCSLPKETISKNVLDIYLTKYDLKRLELYCNNLADYHLIMDLMPTVARLFFLDQLGHTKFTAAQSAILLGLGLQHKTVDDIAKELDLPTTQLLGLFNRSMRKIQQYFLGITEQEVVKDLGLDNVKENGKENMTIEPLAEELDAADRAMKKKQKKEKKKDEKSFLEQSYTIENDDEDWDKALNGNVPSIVSVKSNKPTNVQEFQPPKKKKKFNKKF
ncbi:RNA cytidine acetyltransferase [Cimex lectularius]|uniref:RNA cytidine acetyltransferase n=1 Tax=Cimex lectularius TaxID=79782 RepID=A0A8I6S0U5_CIMLE|nr:RNA cytidine acetyltransferase [Cimex lectularius]